MKFMILYSSSTNDSDDDSGEEDAIWNSYRKQMKSHGLSSSTDSQESFDATIQDVTSSNQNVSVDAEPLEGIQSWAQMLQDVASSVHTLSVQQQVVAASSSSELHDMTAGDALPNSGLLGKPPTVSKVGKKAKVRKHAKKKKKTQANQDGETSKSKQKVKDITKEQDSEPLSEVKSENICNTGTIPNDKATLTQDQGQTEDINKIKVRLEAQISARKGFGVLPSQEVVYDKVCCDMYVYSDYVPYLILGGRVGQYIEFLVIRYHNVTSILTKSLNTVIPYLINT